MPVSVVNKKRHSRQAAEALSAVLPPAVDLTCDAHTESVVIGGQALRLVWIGAGNLADARKLVASIGIEDADPHSETIAVARHLSPGARETLSAAGVGWVDESGAVEIATGSILISHPGQPSKPTPRLQRWTPAVLGVAEALLTGTKATVEGTAKTTGLSVGSCTNALRFLTDRGLLKAAAHRGRGSAREIRDRGDLLDAYATAASEAKAGFSITVGAIWQDPIAGLVETGGRWESAGIEWASTGTAAAAVLAPLLTSVTSTEVYVGTATLAGLVAAAREAGLAPIEGGRLTLRTPPTVTTLGLADEVNGLRVAPWPRVFVDLRRAGVRGEEAAEHLREIAGDGGS